MRFIYRMIGFIVVCLFAMNAFAQNKIVIDDRTSIITPELEQILQRKFLEKDIYLTNSVDFREKCNYYFSSITKENNFFKIDIQDCNNKVLGSVLAGSNLQSIPNDEKAIIIFYNLWDIIENPREMVVQLDEKTEEVKADTLESEHDSRYFFAPTALPLRKRELYYNSLYFLLHDIQYGITNRLTIGMGTTVIGLPVYFTGKYSIPIQENSHLAFGDMLILGTYGTNFFGNLAFATYTYGNSHSNFSIGGGHLYFNPNDNSRKSSSVVGNISGIYQAGKYFYLLTENYLFNFQSMDDASRDTQLPDGSFIFEERQYNAQRTIWYGLTGIRFIRKSNELVSWQIGFTHVLIAHSDIPAPYNTPEWSTFSPDGGYDFFTFPTFSFIRKFKL